MHQALYRKWRPQTFDEVCGQEHITSVLRYEAEHGAFSHAYLFCGSRGTGKTSCAKILAKAVNCEHPVGGNPCGSCAACRAIDSGAATDVLEMDAASNNGVDNIRDIRDEVVYSPSELKYRVYIIDEVHMLSVSAFNALLKTLEEPPEHVIFILATTELQKLPATIISRCQRFDFRRISTDALISRLTYIAKQENIGLEPDAARALAKLAQGGMRDAISLLELCAGVSRQVNLKTVEDAVGLVGRGAVLATAEAVTKRDYDALFAQIDSVVRSSKDLTVFWQDLISLWRDMLVFRTTRSAKSYLDLTEEEAEQLSALSGKFRKETLLYHCRLLEDAFFAMQKANAVKRVVAEMTLIRMCDETLDTSSEALVARIAKLEDAMVTPRTLPAQRTEETDNAAPAEPKPVPGMPEVRPEGGAAAAERNGAADGARRVLRPVKNWMDVVERLARSTPMVASFVKTARAFTTEDGSVLVRFDNDFPMRMMEQDESRDQLRMALSAVLKREIGERELNFEVASKESTGSAIDEIIGEMNEDR